MIEVTRHKGQADGRECHIEVKGHAHYAKPGNDIVCAAVSALTQTLIQSIEELTAAEMKYSISPGMVDIKFKDSLGCAHTLAESFFIGVKMIAEEYPNHVRIVQALMT